MISTRCTVHSTHLELWSCSAVAHLTTRMCVEGEREGTHVVVCSVCYVYVIRSTHIALYWYM